MKNKDKLVLVSGSVVFRRKKGGTLKWLLVKEDLEGDWEIPKTIARKGESSVRASIRNMGETAGMRAKVLEEVGRSGGAGRVEGEAVTQRILYYLMVYKGGEEVLEYAETGWFDYSNANKKLKSKREKSMLKDARDLLKALEKERGKKYHTK